MVIAAARLRPRFDESAERLSCGRRPRTRIERVHAEGMGAHRDAWSDLATRALEPNVFLEPAFMLALTDVLAEGAKPQFLLAWDADAGSNTRLMAVLPLRGMRRGGTRIARGFKQNLITSGTPLVDRERGVEAFADMLGWLAAMRPAPWALALADVSAEGPFWTAVTEAGTYAYRELGARERAVLFAGLPAAPSKKRLKELARQRRRLAERGPLTFASASSKQAVANGFERFLELEALGWKGRRGGALASDQRRKAFARAMVAGMAERGSCRIDTLLLDDAPIAMGIVLRSGDYAAFWKTAFDERLASASPGAQLALELTGVQERDPSLTLTDSCAIPGHPMIDGLWSGRIRIVDVLIATSPSAGLRRFALAIRLELFRRGSRALTKRALSAGRHALRRGAAILPSTRPRLTVGATPTRHADRKGTRP